MDRIIVLMGPSMVGKTTIAKNISNKLGVNKISTDTLCHNHTYHNDDEEEVIELFDDLRKYVIDANVKIVDIGSNTIENCGKKELDYLKKCLTIDGKEPIFYVLLPHENNNVSFSFLSLIAKKLHIHQKEVIDSLKESLTTDSFTYLKPKVIYTLKDYKKPLIFTTNSYYKHLENLSNNLIKDISLIKKQK